jgi:parvulin-like peptidyl-prolyl isomerase
MKITFKVLIVFALFSLILFAEVIANINHKEITREDVNHFLIKSIPGTKYELMSAMDKRKVVNQLVDRVLYLEVAKRENIEADFEYQQILKRESENLMLTVWMKRRAERIPVSDAEIREYYNTHEREFRQVAAASARHILVQTLSEARDIISQLENSKNLEKHFISLAKQKSTGPSSINGGDLGWFNHDQMVKEFSDAAMQLNEGEISRVPVKTHFGYHIIYLTAKRPAGKIALEEVQQTIRKVIRAKKFKKYLEQLREKLKKSAKISVK